MFVAISEKNNTIFGIGDTELSAIRDVEENCIHAFHPLVKKQDTALLVKVENEADFGLVEIKEYIDYFEVELLEEHKQYCRIIKNKELI
jgi:hypothetical protein